MSLLFRSLFGYVAKLSEVLIPREGEMSLMRRNSHIGRPRLRTVFGTIRDSVAFLSLSETQNLPIAAGCAHDKRRGDIKALMSALTTVTEQMKNPINL